ncbi:MAG: sugar ABC transporter permease [Planctomycetaceae bacterium]|nr:sugar ABC transporter permease [Planctomycetaceae bacterium]MCP4464575.1 sugar ABC transporter permease [Planctomycetaceae bacterium]MDG1807108.1 sugar ABC transporter permease [Pirellulaceae bacterium]MDG2105025.1 sugar ABC transporter permease [Pirellulaceae bacterium]
MKRRNLIGYLFASPWLVGFLLLIAWPFAASIYWSFCQYDLINPPEWVGAENYQRLLQEFREGRGFAVALQNTAYYALLSVPLSIIVGMGLAIALSWKVRGQAFYRTAFYLPAVIPIVATSVLWMWLLDPQDGMVNYLLSWLGIPGQNWLTQSRSAFSLQGLETVAGWAAGENQLLLFGSKDALVLMSVWAVGNAMIIFLAAMGDVPEALYEAATIDGAGRFRKFWHVTLPMLSPVILFNLVMGLIKSVQTFTSIYILSEGTGQPGESLLVFSLHLFLSAFSDLEMGYASAMAWVTFVILVVCTLLLFRSSKHWVYYSSQ